ncbi:MAG: methyltransferase domain-containing protein [Patescibacteria group bacterium]|jgi:ubiquinone/menaquinone biosynthesis C-methylase UbiE
MLRNNFTIEAVADFWDKVAEIYDQTNKKIGSTHFQRFTESLKHLEAKPGDKILNIWSRTGNAIPYLKEIQGITIYNLEVSPKMVQIAKAKFPDQNFQLTNLKSLPFPNNFFDAILSLETLEHAPNPQILIDEFFRILKPQKKLVMSLPPKTAELPLKIYETFFTNHGEGPHQFLPSKIVKQIMKQAGFEIVIHKGTLLIPVGPKLLKEFGEIIIKIFQKTPVKELGIRQFYVGKKPQ